MRRKYVDTYAVPAAPADPSAPQAFTPSYYECPRIDGAPGHIVWFASPPEAHPECVWIRRDDVKPQGARRA